MDQPTGNASRTSLLAETAACIRFFSRVPLPRIAKDDDVAAIPDFTQIARAIPLAGAVLGVLPALLLLLLTATALPGLVTASLVVIVQIMLTGALHEDGLADVSDGFFGGSSLERRLEIMKDSRTGAFGALALCLTVLLRIVLIAELLARFGPLTAAAVLIGIEAGSRALMVWQWKVLPPARPDGLGARFGVPDTAAANQAAVFGALCLLPVAAALPVPHVSLALVLAGLAAWGSGKLALAKIGGFTGDVLGAVQQVALLSFMTGLLVLPYS